MKQFNTDYDIYFDQSYAEAVRDDINRFIDEVLYDEKCYREPINTPIKICVGDTYLEIPMNYYSQDALKAGLQLIAEAFIYNYEP